MICLYQEKGNCCGCTACFNSCPHSSITMETDEEGFLYPKIDTKTCTECGICVKVCPFHKKEWQDKIPKEQEVYALRHPDKEILKGSTSGGAFTVLSDYILNQGGLVYGAVFNDSFDVEHACAEMKSQRDFMKGSKYVQSNLKEIFKEVKEKVKEGRLVLFTGTPCQNDGLKSYMGKKEYDNLILCDIACHGVPSPKIWKDYKKLLELKYQDNIKKVNFRSKDTGWRNSSIKVDFNRKQHLKNMQEDPYYILFFSHLSLRPSCYQCVYTSFNRVTDFTLADFWGAEKLHKEFSDDLGVSLLLVNTEKGRKIFSSFKNNLNLNTCSHNDFYQPIFEMPSKKSPRREQFWRDYLKGDGVDVIKQYGRLTKAQWVIKKVVVPIFKITGLYYLATKIYFSKVVKRGSKKGSKKDKPVNPKN